MEKVTYLTIAVLAFKFILEISLRLRLKFVSKFPTISVISILRVIRC